MELQGKSATPLGGRPVPPHHLAAKQTNKHTNKQMPLKTNAVRYATTLGKMYNCSDRK